MAKREMLINYVPGEECRIAITEEGLLEELYQERASNESHVGNIYKGKVTNVEPSIQAAFIDFGLERNGFLHITDLHPRYFPGDQKEETERVGKKTPHRNRPPIQNCLKRGQDILVQVIKEGIGTKGPTLTSYLSIPGRFIVMMPHMERLGVSRKVEDLDQRREMKQMLDELSPPKGFGFIIRTAGHGKSKTDLKRDLSYLQRLWKAIDTRMKEPGIGELYVESDLVVRTIRDVFSSEIERIIVDDKVAARRASEFLAIASPRARSKVLFYDDPIPLYNRFAVEKQIENIQSRFVPLPSGGSLVIDSTEALVAIDVNSGKMRQNKDGETTAYKTNQEAVDEICRQLRLRDLGGLVVMDLIDMRELRKRKSIEQRVRDNLKKDRARTKALNISQFGLMEMTRQRMRPSLKRSVYSECSTCSGTGHIKSDESVVIDAMRRLALVCQRQKVARIELRASAEVAAQLLNRKRPELVALESACGVSITIKTQATIDSDTITITPYDENNRVISINKGGRFAKPNLVPVEHGQSLLELDEEELVNEDAPTTSQTEKTEKTHKAERNTDGDSETEQNEDEDSSQPRKRRRRRGGRRRRSSKGDGENSDAENTSSENSDNTSSDDSKDNKKSEASSPPRASQADGPAIEVTENDSDNTDPSSKDKVESKSESESDSETGNDEDGETKPKRRRRGRRGGRRRRNRNADNQENSTQDSGNDAPSPSQGNREHNDSHEAENQAKQNTNQAADTSNETRKLEDGNNASNSPESGEHKKRPRRRGGRGRGRGRGRSQDGAGNENSASHQEQPPVSKGYRSNPKPGQDSADNATVTASDRVDGNIADNSERQTKKPTSHRKPSTTSSDPGDTADKSKWRSNSNATSESTSNSESDASTVSSVETRTTSTSRKKVSKKKSKRSTKKVAGSKSTTKTSTTDNVDGESTALTSKPRTRKKKVTKSRVSDQL